ncbi:MAG: pantoate--beta-alanine ligase [Dehalococcoidia bacterium]
MRDVPALRTWRAAARADSGPVGFVPTMGALHAGHVSLAETARAECPTVIASLFVNPTQFGPNEDFTRYPRDEAGDLAKFEAAGVDAVFVPPLEVMYPEGHSTTVHVDGITDRLEGAHRPGHFDGVTTIVTKLFNLVQPDRAYFGQKDAQQLATIRKMVLDLDMPIDVVACPTVRDPDGLALSSRNVYLSADERRQALSLSRGLTRAREAFEDGITDAPTLRDLIRQTVEAQPLASIDYVSVADAATLEELEGLIEAPALCSLAVRFGGTRLIDNAVLTP